MAREAAGVRYRPARGAGQARSRLPSLGNLLGWARAQMAARGSEGAAPETAPAIEQPPARAAPAALAAGRTADAATTPSESRELVSCGAMLLLKRHPGLFPDEDADAVGIDSGAARQEAPPGLQEARRIVMGAIPWSLDGWRAALAAYRRIAAQHGEPADQESPREIGATFWAYLRRLYSPVYALAHGIRFFEMKHFVADHRDALVRDGLLPPDAAWDTMPAPLARVLACAPFTAVQPASRRAVALAGVPFRFEYAHIVGAYRERMA